MHKINNSTEFNYFKLCPRNEKTPDSKSVPRFHIAHVFILFEIQLLFSFQLSVISSFQIANVLIKFLKIKVHQKEFYSEILLKIDLGKKLFCVNKHFDSLELENFLLQNVLSKVVKYSSSKSAKQ